VNDLEAFELASDGFGARLQGIRDDIWNLGTPCEGWNVRTLVDHVVRADRIVPQYLAGARYEDIGLPDDIPGADAIGMWKESRDMAIDAFRAEGALQALVHHVLSDINGELLLFFRFSDNLLHTWDLARAIGANEELDRELVGLCYERTLPFADYVASTGLFGDRVATGDDADVQTKPLALHGRRV
jgi:uncharacterized protein (TIGR03086 family)